MNKIILICLLFLVSSAVGEVRVNEIMASNKNGIRDEDGDVSDWIEIYNPDSAAVNLGGWHLSDKSKNLKEWTFPTLTLAPNSYLVVWASGKDRTNAASALHTNFKNNKSGGFVGLSLPDGTAWVSSVTYPQQYSDVSFGCAPQDPTYWGYCATTTPHAPNSAIGIGFGPDVQFSVSSSTFQNPFTLSLTSSDTNAVIHYILATNSASASLTNLPDLTSPTYTSPIQIAGTAVVRARTFPAQTNYFPGWPRGESYLQIAASVASFSSSLPIVVFQNFGAGDVPAYAGQFAAMQVFEPTNGRSSLTNPPTTATRAVYHRHGSSTLGDAKPNLRVETQDVDGSNNNVPLVGMPSDNDWIFYGTDMYDKSGLHNPLTQELFRQMGHYTVRTRYAEVYIKRSSGAATPITTTDYGGLYVIEEKIKIGANRVDINELWPENTNTPSVTGGYLLSIDRAKTDDFGNSIPQMYAAAVGMDYLDPDYQTITASPAQQVYINNYFNAFYTALYGRTWTNATTGYLPYIDLNSWIDYHLHQVFVFNADMLRLSSYFYKPRNGPIVQGPLWDFDRSFGTGGVGDDRGFNPLRWRSLASDGGTDAFNAANTFNNPWYGRLFTDPDFFQAWIDRYQSLRRTVYTLSNITSQVDYFANQLVEAAPRDATRWRGSGQSDTSPRTGRITADGFTYTFPTPGTFQGEVAFVKTWFTNRLNFMDTNFLAPPVLGTPSGVVSYGKTLTLTASTRESGTTVYYTLDGTDPRLPGGQVSPSALYVSVSGKIALTNNGTVFARNWNSAHHNLTGPGNPPLSSPWSSPTVATFVVAPTIQSISLLPDHRIQLSVRGAAATNCFLEISTDLQSWQTVSSLSDPNGDFEFTDAPLDSTHFYRARQ